MDTKRSNDPETLREGIRQLEAENERLTLEFEKEIKKLELKARKWKVAYKKLMIIFFTPKK